MMIKVNPEVLDDLVKAWLIDTRETITLNSKAEYVHPDDAKDYKKDLKAINRLLGYIGI
jgi:hypothetical protein